MMDAKATMPPGLHGDAADAGKPAKRAVASDSASPSKANGPAELAEAQRAGEGARTPADDAARERMADLAHRALEDTRIQLMMAFRFLDRALWKMPDVEGDVGAWPLATDGRQLHFDAPQITRTFRRNPNLVARAHLHTLLHCIFRHPLHTVRADPPAWNLACDVCVEAIAVELCGKRFALEGDRDIERTVSALERADVPLTPAGVYRALLLWRADPPADPLLKRLAAEVDAETSPFARDSHALWDLARPGKQDAYDDCEKNPSGARGNRDESQVGGHDPAAGRDEDAAGRASQGAGENGRDDANRDENGPDGAPGNGDGPSAADEAAATEDVPGKPDAGGHDGAAEDDSDAAGSEPDGREPADDDPAGSAEDDPWQDGANDFARAHAGRPSRDAHDSPEASRTAQEWHAIATQVDEELRAARQRHGTQAGRLADNLSLANRSRVDYAEFLRRFATREEHLKTNDEEFDYLFYTFGLSQYGNVALVEPLEYADDRCLRDFVIAIDTSGSCSGGLTQAFVTRTYEILSQACAPSERMNVHIVECDAQVQSDTLVTGIGDLRAFERGFEAHGFGGTDFRPVFDYVDQLVARGAFTDLRGLVYFTDGFGTFPERAPAYDVAFVFVERAGKQRRVPPWACKVIMDEDELEMLEGDR